MATTSPPALPLEVIELILSHLVPPTIPLPRHLCAQPLLHRLEFMPPDLHDTDAYLTPSPRPSAEGQTTLTQRLGSLVDHCQRGEILYAYDGETAFARLPLSSTSNPDTPAVRVIFAYEDGSKERGWVYHASELPGNDGLSWSSNILDIKIPARAKHTEDEPLDDDPKPDLTAPQGYWEGFTPPASQINLNDDHEQNDDDYWKSYGTNMGAQTPVVNNGRSETPTDGFANGPAEESIPPVNAGREAENLRDKLESKIMVMLRALWTAWVDGAGNRQDELEEKALSWLRVSRSALELVGKDPLVVTAGNARESTLMAKLQVLRDLFETINQTPDAFWRRVEEVVRSPAIRSEEEQWE